MRLTFRPQNFVYTTLKQNRISAYSLIICMLIVAPLLSILGIEYLVRGSIHQTLDWVMSNKVYFALNVFLAFCVYSLIYAILGSLIVSMGISTLLLGTVSLISYMKTRLIGEPFFPWDILLNKESMSIASLVTGKAALIRIVSVALLFVVILLLRFIVPRLSLPIFGRIALGLFSLYALYAFGVKTTLAGNILDRAGVNEITWNQSENYTDNGLALAFTMNVKNSIVQKPPTYSSEAMATVAGHIQNASLKSSTGDGLINGKQPNVIFVMNEAFWDPTLLTNVNFSEDPVPTIHRLQKESSSGFLLSPQFGGGTSNVEFEVLTGNSMSFLPGGSIPYQQYVTKPVPSLASYFEGKGYKSLAIHSYEGWFWDRNNVYKQFGFEGFKSSENFVNPEVKGYYISDDEVSRSIMQEVDKSDRPMFIYAVTMQNHGPYDENRYGDNPIKVQGPLSDSAKSILETYAHGAHDADQSLQLLIDHFQKSDKPTLIVFYGDHLPMLGYDYQVYHESGFIQSGNDSQWSLEELKKMHSVPMVMWSNFDMPKEQIPVLSNSFLGAHVLDRLNMEKPANFSMDAQLSAQIPGMLSNLVVDSNQQLHAKAPDSAKQMIDDYRNIQYDLLFGKQYLADYIDHDYLTKAAIPSYSTDPDKETVLAEEAAHTPAAAGKSQ